MTKCTPLLALAASAALAACGIPSAPDEVVFGQVVATSFKEDAPFGTYLEAELSRSIIIDDDTSSGVVITRQVQDAVVAQIRVNLEARGYAVTLVAAGAAATPGRLRVGSYALFATQSLYFSQLWCFWGAFPQCIPTWSYAGSYNYGTLIIEAGTDLINPGAPPPVTPPTTGGPVFWLGASYGVMAGGNSISQAGLNRVLASVDQAFDQSPYFTRLP